MQELNDTALMLRYRNGDADAFDTLYARHRGPLFRLLVRQTGSRQAAEDVFQETWSKLIRSRASYRPTASFRTYLLHIARNCVTDHYRRAGRNAEDTNADGCLDATPAVTHDPLQAAQCADQQRLLEIALAALPQEQSEAFLLHEELGLTLEEIGAVTGVGRETVKSRLRYALRRLRTALPATAHESDAHD